MRLDRITTCAMLFVIGCSNDQFGGGDGAADAQQEQPVTPDGGSLDASTTVYSDIASTTAWTTFDTTVIDSKNAGFSGATFDGKYVYFAPATGQLAMRHDVAKSLSDPLSWDTFPMSPGYAGVAFDGRYVYYAPDANGQPFGVVSRFDTQGAFKLATSWTTIDLATLNNVAVGYVGVVFEGRYLYFIPNKNSATSSLFARYDTQAPFNAPTSWSFVDVATFSLQSQGFNGGVFDGRYLYAPAKNSGLVARYDTQPNAFDANTSWAFFDSSAVEASAKNFFGGVFDGRYVYFMPLNPQGTMTRFDTTGSFTAPQSWTAFKTTNIDPRAAFIVGGAFDGRYVYADPLEYTLADGGAGASGLVARYDTTSQFNAAPSWSKFDLTTANPPAAAIGCSVFDGQHVYFASLLTNVVARFDAKTPSSMPPLPAFHGSFF